jgi:protein SCO1/2
MQRKRSQGLAKVLLTASLTLLVFSLAAFILLNLKLKERLSAEGARHSFPVYTRIPPFSLTERSGRPFGSIDLQNKVWIADFIFTTCPGPCPRMSAQMAILQRALEGKEEVRLVSITVDPQTDTPEVLTKYADHYQAKNGYWYFLTGDMATIHRLARDGFMVGGVEDVMMHSTRFILMDRRAQVRGYYDSSDEESLNKLLLDVQKLLQEKAP